MEKIDKTVPYLKHSDKVHIIAVNHLVDKLDELLNKGLVLLEPCSMEVEAKGSTVGVEVPVEVVAQQPGKLLRLKDVGAGGDHVATRQPLVKVGVVPPVELIDDHLPDRVASGGAVLSIAMALVRHAVVQGVGPNGNPAKRRSDGCVIHKELERNSVS